MPQFTDTKGQAWSVDLHVAALKRVAELSDFDLLNLLDDELKGLSELYDNPVKLVEIVYAICQPQIEARELSDEAFGELFAGQVLQAAADALIEAVALFYRSPKQGRILREMRKKIEAGADHQLDKIGEMTEAVDVDDIKAAIDRELGGTETPESEPTPTSSSFATEQQGQPVATPEASTG